MYKTKVKTTMWLEQDRPKTNILVWLKMQIDGGLKKKVAEESKRSWKMIPT